MHLVMTGGSDARATGRLPGMQLPATSPPRSARSR